MISVGNRLALYGGLSMNERQSRSPILERGNQPFQQNPVQQTCNTSAGVGDAIKDAASSVAEKAQEAWDATKHQAEHLASNVADTASNFADEMTGLIRNHPGACIAIGLGIGFLAGLACDRAIR
jgi:ElaB/YqjD/DUF883 family membrane-anchored ribosome-binding protein